MFLRGDVYLKRMGGVSALKVALYVNTLGGVVIRKALPHTITPSSRIIFLYQNILQAFI